MIPIDLIPIDLALGDTLAGGGRGFEERYAVHLGAHEGIVCEMVGASLELAARLPSPPPWGGYLTVDATTRDVVGVCGFKGGPSPNGVVEIACATFPELEGKGYATAMGRALVDIAAGQEGITAVVAHTLPQRNASTTVLERLGLAFAGEVEDPEDGRVWRWIVTFDPVDPGS